MVLEFSKFIFYAILIILVSKYILMFSIRNMSLILKLGSTTIGKITGYATSAPELISSIFASYLGMINTVSYNIISSNIINVLLFIFSLLLYNKINYLKKKKFIFQYTLIIFSIILPLILKYNNIDSNILLVPFFVFLFILYIKFDKYFNTQTVSNDLKIKKIKYDTKKIYTNFIFLIFGITILYLLGDKLGDSLDTLFSTFNIPEYILGIIIGIVTSLPEFVTFISSQSYYNKNTLINNNDLGSVEAINNLLSSNLSNLLLIQSISIVLYNIT